MKVNVDFFKTITGAWEMEHFDKQRTTVIKVDSINFGQDDTVVLKGPITKQSPARATICYELCLIINPNSYHIESGGPTGYVLKHYNQAESITLKKIILENL